MQVRISARLIAMVLAVTSATAYGQAPPPPPASPTLWSFLGIPQASYKIHAQLFNRRGNHPGIEKKPPLRGIADPENLKSDVPAIKAAAEVKQAEDLKPQKIKAIKYLATLGCGCYDKDKKITKALLAAMDDCTEEVRLEAVNAIMEAASGGGCEHCSQRCCCNEEITTQLYKIAYDLDDLGCPVEPSERVRQAAVEALRVCCPSRLPVEDIVAPEPIEGGDRPAPIEGGAPVVPPPPPTPTPATPAPPAPLDNRAAAIDPNQFLRDASEVIPMQQNAPPSSRRTARLRSISTSANVSQPNYEMPQHGHVEQQARPLSVHPQLEGMLSLFDANRNIAHVHFSNAQYNAGPGSRLLVFVPRENGMEVVGELEVVESFPGSANVRPLDGMDLVRIGRHARVYPSPR